VGQPGQGESTGRSSLRKGGKSSICFLLLTHIKKGFDFGKTLPACHQPFPGVPQEQKSRIAIQERQRNEGELSTQQIKMAILLTTSGTSELTPFPSTLLHQCLLVMLCKGISRFHWSSKKFKY